MEKSAKIPRGKILATGGHEHFCTVILRHGHQIFDEKDVMFFVFESLRQYFPSGYNKYSRALPGGHARRRVDESCIRCMLYQMCAFWSVGQNDRLFETKFPLKLLFFGVFFWGILNRQMVCLKLDVARVIGLVVLPK